jgi:hypothetical protein
MTSAHQMASRPPTKQAATGTRWTATWAFSMRPAVPVSWRCTPNRLAALLEIPVLVNDQHPPRGRPDARPHRRAGHPAPVVVPHRPTQQVLHPVRAGVPGVLSERLAVLARQVGQQAQQLLQPRQPPARICLHCAVACGHRLISGCPAAALALSWVSAPLAVALCGLMALYYAFDQARCPLPWSLLTGCPPDGHEEGPDSSATSSRDHEADPARAIASGRAAKASPSQLATRRRHEGRPCRACRGRGCARMRRGRRRAERRGRSAAGSHRRRRGV